jgi:hypothetical protein
MLAALAVAADAARAAHGDPITRPAVVVAEKGSTYEPRSEHRKIVLYLARLEDWSNCSVNDPIVSIIESGGSVADFLHAMANMTPETARGIAEQIDLRNF